MKNKFLAIFSKEHYSLATYSNEGRSDMCNYAFGSPMPGRQYTSASYRYGFNGQEKDDEISGSGNMMTAEYWEYDTRLGRRWNVDPKPMAHRSNYSCFGNNPIFFVDVYGDTEGDYYDKQGNHLGSDGKNDDKAYVADGVTKNDNGLVTGATNSSELSVGHSTLKAFAATVAEESSGDKTESYAIASTITNLSTYKGKGLLKTLQTEGIYGYGKSPYGGDNAEFSMEASINALTGGTDHSNGAIRWDGYDLAARGSKHPKGVNQGFDVSQDHLDAFKAAWPDSKIKAFSGGKYTGFSTNFTAGQHKATASNIGMILFKSSAVHGSTMFWAPNKTATVKFSIPLSFPPGATFERSYDPNAGFKWKHL